MILWILISLFVLFITWILLVPVILFLHTESNSYMVSLPGIFRVAVVPSDELFHIRGRAFFIPFRYHPFRQRRRKKKKETVKAKETEKPAKPAKKRWTGKTAGGIRLGIDLLRSVRIRRLYLDMDTDDFMLNAWLVPVFSLVNSDHIQLKANFTGNMSLLLDLRIRLGSMLYTFIRYKIRSIY
ncbi:MAG TPA: hypothetical protein ENO05_07885 [Bacteroides sp.]|nr:hypothetical protein [Bacteroides sp.]